MAQNRVLRGERGYGLGVLMGVSFGWSEDIGERFMIQYDKEVGLADQTSK